MYGEIPLEWYTERGREIPGPTYIPGEDFDPYDEDDVAAVKLAMEKSMHEQMEDMRRRLAYYESNRSEEDWVDDQYWSDN